MVDIVVSIFLMGTLVCEIAVVVLAYRVVSKIGSIPASIPASTLRDIANAWSERRVAPVDEASTGYNESESRQRAATKVEEIPPEIFAPSLKKPPRPEGGFGSRVSKDDGDP
jgi:hypothetical protein